MRRHGKYPTVDEDLKMAFHYLKKVLMRKCVRDQDLLDVREAYSCIRDVLSEIKHRGGFLRTGNN